MKINIKYQKLESKDLSHLIALIKVYEDVFAMKNFSIPDSTYLNGLLEKDNFIIFVALLDNIIVGGLTAYILPSVYFASSEVYVYDLAVKTDVQRKGIGRNLMTTLKDYCSEQGYKEVFVQADLEDQHAIDFYHATGGAAERVIHFSYGLTKEKK